MAISYVGFATWVRQFTLGTSWTLTKPSGTTTGDLMIGTFIGWDWTAGSFTVPTGWTQLRSNVVGTSGSNQVTVITCYRFCESGDPASWTNGVDPEEWSVASTVVSYRGVDSTNPFIAENVSGTTTDTTTLATATVNNTANSSWRVSIFAQRDAANNTWTSTDTSERGESTAHTNSPFMKIANYDSNGTISTGNTSITGTSSGTWETAASWIGILKAEGAGTSAEAGTVSVTATANAATTTKTVSPDPDAYAATGTANAPTARVGPTPGAASLTTTAYDASVLGGAAFPATAASTANAPRFALRIVARQKGSS